MPGGLIQLVATGSQDIFLTGNPQITFLKTVYRRHTNFAVESIEQTLQGNPDFGQKVSCVVSRHGDLIHKVYLRVELPDLDHSDSRWVTNVGHFLIKEISVEVGGQIVDKHYGDWLNIWNELTQTAERASGYDKMIGASLGQNGGKLYIPLQFWFCRNPGLALPLIALQYHEVKFNVEFRRATDCFIGSATTPQITKASLFIDYVYLDTEERRDFAQNKHDYLIDQLQLSEETYNTKTIKNHLAFNHPCKEFVWVLHSSAREGAKEWSDYSLDGNGAQTLEEASLQFDGHDRFEKRDGDYFNLVQPYQYHTSVPSSGIYVYSFALHPEEHQPSGTMNMSRVDDSYLTIVSHITGTYKLRVYAVNYNVLRIESGMGGLAYSS